MLSKAKRAAKFNPKKAPTFGLAVSYGKSLVRDFEDIDIERALSALGREMLKQVRKNVLQTAYSDRAKKRLSKAVSIQMFPSSLRLTAKDPLWGYLIPKQPSGPYSMAFLRTAKGPIPIVTDSGKVIFRSATAKSFRDGRWVHPGRPYLDVVDQAKKEARKIVQTRMKKEIVRQLQRALG